jgi:hypothetical protein
MLKYNLVSLKKIEKVFEEAGYMVRYEKGNFQSGYCVLENKKVVVINKFHALDARINSLLEILATAELNLENLDEEGKEFVDRILKSKSPALG